MAGDGIKILIDLDSKTHGASAADKALKRVEDAAKKANHHLGEMDHHGGMLTSNIFKAEFAMKAFEKGAELAKEAISEIGHLIKETFVAAADERREKMALTNLLGGKEEAELAIHYLDRFNELTGVGENQTKAMGIELLNSGYKGQEWKDALAAIGDAASMSANRLQGASDAMSSFMRMRETGRLDARILRGLHLNVGDVTKGLADSLGMSPKAVKKALSEGAVPAAKAFETILKAIEKKTGHALGENALNEGKQLTSKLTLLRELPEKIMKAVSESPGIDRIGGAIDRVMESFDPEGPKGKKIVKGLSSLMDSVGLVLEKTDWADLTMRIGGVATTIGTWIGPLAKVAEYLVKIADVALKIPTALFGLGERIGEKAGNAAVSVKSGSPLSKASDLATLVTNPLAAPGLVANKVASYAPTDVHQKWLDEEWEKRQRAMSSTAVIPTNRLGDLGAAAGKSGNVHVEGKAQVVVNVHGEAAKDPKAIGEATRRGVETGLTTALEQQALHAGTRSARRRRVPQEATP